MKSRWSVCKVEQLDVPCDGITTTVELIQEMASLAKRRKPRSPATVETLKLVAFVLLILHLTSHVAPGILADSDPSYVFPMQIGNHRQTGANLNRLQNALYINPNPSTRSQPIASTTPRQQMQQQQQTRRSPNSSDRIGSTPSSIGKSEQSQVAEWPFFKSLQTVRQTQSQLVANAKQRMFLPDELDIAAKKSMKSDEKHDQFVRGAQDEANKQQKLRKQELTNSSAPSRPTSTSTSTSTTTTTTTTTTPTSKTQVDDASEDSPKQPADANGGSDNESTSIEMISTTMATTTLQAQTAEATTTDRPSTGEISTTTEPSKEQYLFAPDLHSTIQEAVNRIVKMTEQTPTKVAATGDQRASHVQSGPPPLRSSLSLNVLLKNFGLSNLANLDQILLKSSLKNDTSTRMSKEPAGVIDQKIEINGLFNQQQTAAGEKPKEVKQMNGGSPVGEQGLVGREPQQSAECKIEYTMRHVNISLLNGGNGDYTCDYIIDRKMAGQNGEPTGIQSSGANRVCKLQLRSRFFSNEELQANGTKLNTDDCDGQTHLIVGSSKFCYLSQKLRGKKAQAESRSLDKIFDFPAQLDAFDLRMVHKQRSSDDVALENPEIYLEIKPLSGNHCEPLQSGTRPVASSTPQAPPDSQPLLDSSISSAKAAKIPTISSTSSTTTPEPSQPMSLPARTPQVRPQIEANDGNSTMSSGDENKQAEVAARDINRQRSRTVAIVTVPKSSFVLKVTPNRQPHPISRERFKVSQNFDVSSTPQFNPNRRTDETLRARDLHTGLELCDSLTHVATVGQLSSPNYPAAYAANESCYFVIKQAMSSYCQLLLHFRDFDLVSKQVTSGDKEPAGGSTSDDCSGDYLQIGETRYCNKYAMIGHRMKLDFPSAPAEPLLIVRFVSDQNSSGRGFLIKYQQLSCEPSKQTEQHPQAKPKVGHQLSSTTQIGDLLNTQEPPKFNTLAPPQEKPDFSLALKTKAPQQLEANKTSPAYSVNDLEHNKFNERTGSLKQTPTSGQSLMVASTSLELAATTRSSDWSSGVLLASEDSAPQMHCNQVRNEMSFVLASPETPSNYPNNAQCLYYVRRNSTKVCYLELTFISFDLEADTDCRFDYLEINGVRLCGSLRDMAPHKTTRIYLFEEPIKLIKFKSDSSGSKSGFYIRVDQLECNQSGSILRQSKALDSQRVRMIDNQQMSVLTSNGNFSGPSARTIEYDSFPIRQTSNFANQPDQTIPAQRFSPATNTGADTLQTANLSPGSPLSSKPNTECDQVLHGKEVTIKSPLWPDSYANDESISVCRYTIVRNTLQNWRASNGKKICQLELRFVNLRLGTSDCIDVDGYEVLCGFNTNNMVKYYPFERQSHLTISFFTGTAKFAAARSLGASQNGADLLPSRTPFRFMIVAKQHACVDGFLAPQADVASSDFNQTNNLLYSGGQQPALRYANRTDPSIQPASSSSANKRKSSTDSLLRYDFSNSTPMLTNTQLTQVQRPSIRQPINRPTLMYSLNGNNGNISRKSNLERGSAGCSDGSVVKQADQIYTAHYPSQYQDNSHCSLVFERASERACHLEVDFLDLDLHGTDGNYCQADYIQFNHGERYCSMQQVIERLGPKQQLLLPFNIEGKIVLTFQSTEGLKTRRGLLMLHRQLDCALRPLASKHSTPTPQPTQRLPIGTHLAENLGDQQQKPSAEPNSADSEPEKVTCLAQFAQYSGIISSSSMISRLKSGLPSFRSECNIIVKLLPGFCHLQLNFNEFELSSRNLGYCLLDFLELNDGIQYCAEDLKGINKTLSVSPSLNTDTNSHRSISMRYSITNSSSSNGFRAIFKQIECQPESLRPIGNMALGSSQRATNNMQTSRIEGQLSSGLHELDGANKTQKPTGVELNSVDFKEVRLHSEYFELNSAKLSKSPQGYDPNMFIVYRIRRWHPEVCKIRLMFYQFDLEPSAGCKRDFLDINNVDRLCGHLGKPEEFRRDYDWSSQDERDFLISFVSDSSRQQDGYLLFGQQLRSNCTNTTSPPQQLAQPTFDEESPKQADLSIESPPSEQDHKAGHVSPESIKEPATDQNANPTPSSLQQSEPSNCYKLHYESKFEISSPSWPQKYGPKTTCYHLIHKTSDSDTCSVSFNIVSMILGSEEKSACNLDEMDYLEIDGQPLCGLITRPQLIIVPFGKRQFITVKFVSHQAKGFGFFIEAKQNKCPSESGSLQEPVQVAERTESPNKPVESTPSLPVGQSVLELSSPDQGQQNSAPSGASCNQLLLDEINYIESENFPKRYKHNQDCLYAVRRQNQSVCAIDIVMNYFDLDMGSVSTGSCELDYIEIDYSRFCGSYPANHRLRFNYFSDELDKMIRFHTDSTVSRAGFSLAIKQVTSDCATNSPGAIDSSAKMVDMISDEKQVISNKESPKTSGHTTQMANDEIINYLPDSTGASMSGSVNNQPTALNSSSPPSEQANAPNERQDSEDEARQVGANFGTLCQFVYHKQRQILLSPSYSEQRRQYQNNVDCLYKIVAKSYDFCSLKLTIIDLDLERSSDCHNDYLLIDNKRYCGNSSSPDQRPIEVQFADTLPREIHLLYHTNGHLNDGRGFKLAYEQQPCSQLDDQSFALQNGDLHIKMMHQSAPSSSSDDAQRQTRRLRFGQLSYPKNYVSSQQAMAKAQQYQKQQQQQQQQQSTNQFNRPSSGQARASTARQASRQGEQRGLDLDSQHDDQTLRKEIVVVKSNPVVFGGAPQAG